MGNAGLILPEPGYLEALREITEAHGALLVFDEVMTGFRVGLGGAQERFGVTPDLTTLGKVIGAGLPVGAFGGRREIMEQVAPAGPIYQAGTLSGNPLATAAGQRPAGMARGQRSLPRARGLRPSPGGRTPRGPGGCGDSRLGGVAGSMFGVFFHPGPVRSFEDAKAADIERFNRFHRAMLNRGVFLAPSAFEAGFLSIRHGEAELEATLAAARGAAAEVAGG
jgi:glutamate-1-semialdehyde 2,1-aminomutase